MSLFEQINDIFYECCKPAFDEYEVNLENAFITFDCCGLKIRHKQVKDRYGVLVIVDGTKPLVSIQFQACSVCGCFNGKKEELLADDRLQNLIDDLVQNSEKWDIDVSDWYESELNTYKDAVEFWS